MLKNVNDDPYVYRHFLKEDAGLHKYKIADLREICFFFCKGIEWVHMFSFIFD